MVCQGKRRPSPTPWPDLPPELGGLILGRLPCHVDRLRFRSVCRQWRLAAQQQQHPPRRLPPALPLLCLSHVHGTFQSILGGDKLRFEPPGCRASSVRCRGCFGDWLLFQPRDLNRRTCFLINPTSGATIEGVPLHLDAVGGGGGRSRTLSEFPMRKVVVCSPDLVASLGGRSVAFYRRGAPSWSLCPSDDDHVSGRWYVDMALHGGKLYALTSEENLFIHELGGGAAAPKLASHVVVKHAAEAQTNPYEFPARRYLVGSSCGNKLLMVKWIVRSGRRWEAADLAEGVKMWVFEADLEMRRWVEVEDLGDDQALFVGRGCSRALRLAGDDPMFRGNRIYFLGLDFAGVSLSLRDDEIPKFGFYDMRSRRVSKVLLDELGNVRNQLKMERLFP